MLDNDTKIRYTDFWAHEKSDREEFSVEARKKIQTGDYEALRPANPTQHWADMENRHKIFEHYLQNTLFLGESFPLDWINLGPGCLASCLGSGHTWAWDTVWFGEEFTLLKDWSDLDKVQMDESAEMYKLLTGMTQLFCDRSQGRYTVGVSDLGGNMDIVASLRDTQTLLYDLYDNPEEVKKAVRLVDDAWEEMYSRLHRILKQSGQEGMTTWQGLWCKDRYFPLQCDFSAMISPDQFAEFILPSLRRSVNFLDHSIYHWDGPGEIPHLDHLLSLERLDCIQWTSGDGNPPLSDEKWFPLYEKIQAAGKNVILLGTGNVEQSLKILKHLDQSQLFISCWLDSEEEAEELLAKAVELA